MQNLTPNTEAIDDAHGTAETALLTLQSSLTLCESLATEKDVVHSIREALGYLNNTDRCMSEMKRLSMQSTETQFLHV